jgi:ribosomal protein L12E/L44/L45/RPP1/RPP2
VVKATVDALLRLKAPAHVARLRGLPLEDVVEQPAKAEKAAPAAPAAEPVPAADEPAAPAQA